MLPSSRLASACSAPAKWMVLVASIWIQSFSGNPYSFYSPTLKTVLGFNQFQLNVLAVAKDVGEHVGILAGYLCNKIPTWATLSIGAVFAFIGYGLLWLVTSRTIEPLPYWVMLVVICVASNSATWFNTAVLVTCMRNFPQSRGTIAGFLKGFVGLSSAIYTFIFTAFLSSDPVTLLFFLTVGPASVSLISMSFIRPIQTDAVRDEGEEQSSFFFINVLCIVLAAYLLAAALVEEWVSMKTLFIPRIVAGVMLLFLVVPILVPVRLFVEGFCLRYGESDDISTLIESVEPFKQPLLGPTETSDQATLPNEETKFQGNRQNDRSCQAAARRRSRRRKAIGGQTTRLPDIDEMDEDAFFLALAEGAVRAKKRPRRGEDFKLKQALVKADFWLLFVAFFCGVGSGVVVNDNLAQLAEAQGYTDVAVFVALVSICNFLGRLGGGFVSEHYVRLAAIPRPVWMAATQAVMIVANVLFALATPGSLLAACAIMGICYGVQFSVMIPTASELFGLRHFGIIYNFINLTIPLGSLFFSALLAGFLYDLEAEKESNISQYSGLHMMPLKSGWSVLVRGSDTVCSGAHCFKLTFLIMAGVCVVGMIFSAILSYRIRPVYQTLYPARGDPNNLSSASLPTANLSSSSLDSPYGSYSSLPPANLSSSALPPAVGLADSE